MKHCRGATTIFERQRVTGGASLLLILPASLAVGAIAAALGAPVATPVGLLILLVVVLWPLRRERLRFDSRRASWRDRVFGYRFRARLEKVTIHKTRAESQHGLLLSDGRAQHLLATGEEQDIEALAQALDAALRRAGQSDRDEN